MRGGEGFLTENDLIKKCKKGSRTPFDILRDFQESPNDQDANLFKLYYFAFKGQRQLNWSPDQSEQFQLPTRLEWAAATECVISLHKLGKK